MATGGAVKGGSDSTSTAVWTDERIALATERWLAGDSAAQVAKQLGGVSRSSVIGKMNRLGLSSRSGTVRQTAFKPAPEPRAAPSPKLRVSPTPSRRPPMVMPVPMLAEIEARPSPAGVMHACKWPIGDPRSPDFRFCGQEAELREDGTARAYCRSHSERAYLPAKTTPARFVRSLRHLR